MFSKFDIKRCYRTRKDDVTKELLVPLLSKSIKYDRGTGFFSLQSLSVLADGLIPYIRRGGNIRIVTSVELGKEETEAILKGEELAKKTMLESIELYIDEELVSEDALVKLDLIVNLIAAGRLQIRIGYLEDGGIYHEKLGLFQDEDGEKVCFIGSSNETHSGYKKNVESICVMKSWTYDLSDILEQEDYFDSLWNDNDESIRVFRIPEAVERHLITKFRVSSSIEDAIEHIENYEEKGFIKKKELYPYQEQAIDEFVSNSYCHFFEMATGTGKTFTAVNAIKRCYTDLKRLLVVIIVPQIDLQIQWKEALEELDFDCTLFGGISKETDWEDAFNRVIIDFYNTGMSIILSVYDTYFDKLNDRISTLDENKLLIVDEAHELSNRQMMSLPESYNYRLGLSATPERHDASETERIIKFFTQNRVETYKYLIDEAIGKFLCRYEYHPLVVELADDEFESYKALTMQLIVLLNQKERDNDAIRDKSNRRSVIVKKAKNKLSKLRDMILDDYNFSNAVVYCGQGKDNDSDEVIVDIVTRYLTIDGKYNVSQFTSKTENRPAVLKEFENGYYDTLVAIKCFDQGVDVPKLDKIYIMASDALSRQTIQRRGRVLRKCTDTGKKLAYIYDMIVVPPLGMDEEVGAKSLVVNELKRAKEYMRLSENKNYYQPQIDALESQFGITEEDYRNEREEE